LADLIHDDHVLKRRTVGVYDPSFETQVSKPKEERKEATRSTEQRSDGIVLTKENDSKQTVRSIFYRGRKYLKSLAEHTKLTSKNRSYWDLDEEKEEKPLVRQLPNEILKPLPISNKQLRNKFMRAKMKHFQIFGRQV